MKVSVYGDSIMKGAVPDEAFRYRFVMRSFMESLMNLFPLQIINRSKFGSTITQGSARLDDDLTRGIDSGYLLLEYGGNDCDFYWDEVSATPEADHDPKTVLSSFTQTLSAMVEKVRAAGITPLLMTLPPIDAEKYLDFIVRNGLSKENIVKWLGDVQMIYRFQEMYSDAITSLARALGVDLFDVRSRFLDKHNYHELISVDGIHPTRAGYEIVYRTFADHLKNRQFA